MVALHPAMAGVPGTKYRVGQPSRVLALLPFPIISTIFLIALLNLAASKV
jgi:hypothetical protein